MKATTHIIGRCLDHRLALAAVLAFASLAPVAAAGQTDHPKPNHPQQDRQQEHQQEHPKNNNGKQQNQQNRPYSGAWLKRYQAMPSEQSEQALRNEKDFQNLPPERQQHLVQRLHEFANKPPQERERTVERLQAIEKMPAQEREELRQANELRKDLPQERKREVNRAYNFLRELPPGQQEQMLNSPAFQQRFSEQERGIVRGLLKAPQLDPPLGSTGGEPQR